MSEWISRATTAEVVELERNGTVVMMVPLAVAARGTVRLPAGSVLVVFMNEHPRPSFTIPPTSGGETLVRVIRERFDLGDDDAAALARAIERELEPILSAITE